MVQLLTITTLIFGFLAIIFSFLLDKEKHKQQEKQDLSLFMIHELRSPLSSIKAATSLLMSDTGQIEKQKKADLLKLINSQSLQLLEYVSLLLDTSRLQSGIFNLQKKPNDIKSLVEERIDLLQPLALERQIDLHSDIKEPVPSFRFDKEYIAHALDNLLYNALKFTPEKGKIDVNVLLDNQFVTINVTDSGEGLDQEQMTLLFKKFSQVGQKTANSSGLGLYFVKNIIDAHKGKINVSSVVGKGTTFSFSLPFSNGNG